MEKFFKQRLMVLHGLTAVRNMIW